MRRLRYFVWRMWVARRNSPQMDRCLCGLPFFRYRCSSMRCWDEGDWQAVGYNGYKDGRLAAIKDMARQRRIVDEYV